MSQEIAQFLELYNQESLSNDYFLIIINYILLVLCSFILKILYENKSSSLSGKFHVGVVIPILSQITFLIILIVKSSLALSLGLIGALSIVRFRTPIKEPEELIYLFLVISTGLGLGANQVKITVLGVGVALIIIIIFSLFSNKKIKNLHLNNFQLSFVLNKNITDEIFSKILLILNKNCKEIDFISMSSEKNESSIHFEIYPNSVKSISTINKELKNIKDLKVVFSRKNHISL